MDNNIIQITSISFVAGYLTSSFNMISFTMGCITTYFVLKINDPNLIKNYIMDTFNNIKILVQPILTK